MFNPRFVKLPSSATTSHLSLANLSIKRDYFEYERFMKSGALQHCSGALLALIHGDPGRGLDTINRIVQHNL